jgi:hypothetical protein
MLHGKKGFERIVWAAKNVLNQSLVWLLTGVSKSKAGQWCCNFRWDCRLKMLMS